MAATAAGTPYLFLAGLYWAERVIAEPISEAGKLSAAFNGRSVVYDFSELDALVPAYAAAVHKSQGSGYPAVVIPVLTQHYAMLQRNLL